MDRIEFRIAFGKRIEKFRKKLGLSYWELAQICAIGLQISDIWATVCPKMCRVKFCSHNLK